MAKNNSFSKLVEYIIADDTKKAKALFHQIVVNKSRKIYETMEMDEDPSDNFDDVESDELAGHNPGPINDGEFADEHGGDEADDFQDDVYADDDMNSENEFNDHDDLEHGEDFNASVDDRVSDLESQYDELKAEFEQLLHSEDEEVESEEDDLEDEDEGLDAVEDEVDDDDFDEDEEAEDEFEDEEDVEDEDSDDDDFEDDEDSDDDFEDEEDEEEDDDKVDESFIREYVDKVTKGLSNDSEESFVNKKSTVAGKNEIVKGIGPGNIATGKGGEKGRPTPTSKPLSNERFQNAPGSKAKLSSAPKSDRNKEREGTNKKSPID